MGKKFILGIAIIILIAIVVIIIIIPKSESNTIKVGNLPIAAGLPWYLAIEKGYFEQEEINIDFIRFDSPNQIIDALVQNKIQFTATDGATGIVGISEYKNPGNLKIYGLAGGTLESQNEAILITNNSNIKTIADLKEKRLGILAGTIQWRTIARELLAQNGLEFDKDVEIVELATGLQAQALQNNQIDALLGLEPIPTIITNNNMGKTLIEAPVEKIIANPIYSNAGIVNAKFAEENPELTKKIINIIDKAIKEINENPDEARQYLLKYTSLDENTAKKVPLPVFKLYYDLDENDKNNISKFYNIFTKYNVVDGNIDFESFILGDNNA